MATAPTCRRSLRGRPTRLVAVCGLRWPLDECEPLECHLGVHAYLVCYCAYRVAKCVYRRSNGVIDRTHLQLHATSGDVAEPPWSIEHSPSL